MLTLKGKNIGNMCDFISRAFAFWLLSCKYMKQRQLAIMAETRNEVIDFNQDYPYNVEKMPKTDSLGQFEQLVLTAILILREGAYGVSIHSKVQELARPRAVSLGAVYVTLDRLEDKGLVASWLSDPTPERGGRAKRCYRLEALGERALQESAVTAKRIWDVIAEVWGKEWAKEWGKQLGKEAG
jgi:PadR family transcriptional regulator, regulatory protein PadR